MKVKFNMYNSLDDFNKISKGNLQGTVSFIHNEGKIFVEKNEYCVSSSAGIDIGDKIDLGMF